MAIGILIFASAVLAAIMALAFGLANAKDDTKSAAVGKAILSGQLDIAKSNVQVEKDRADKEKSRADRLDNLIAKYAAQTVAGGDPHGQYKLLLQEWAADGTTGAGPNHIAVPTNPTPAAPDPNGLAKPGD